jgi:uncharacterized membrane protein
MRQQFFAVLDEVRSSYWFVPSLMTLAAFGLSWLTLTLDQRLGFEVVASLPLVYVHQPEGARSLLSTVAGSMIGVAGVSFSILMVVLPMASQQFGPRLLRNFMRDRGSQIVLGTFVANFLYCLLVLRTVRGDGGVFEAEAFVPQLSVSVALAFTLFNLGVFIYFIHHTAGSIRMSHVLAEVSHGLGDQIVADSPASEAEAGTPVALPADYQALRAPLRSASGHYLRAVDEGALLGLASEHGAIVELHAVPGDYLMAGEVILSVYPGSALKELEAPLRRALSFGQSRTEHQDLRFAFDQLLEVALRALSTGVNDPYTAMMCTDRIADNLARLANRPRSSPYHLDEGALRLVWPPLEPEAELHRLFGPLRGNAADSFMVMAHLLAMLVRLSRVTSDPGFRAALAEEAERVRASAETGLTAGDYQRLAERYSEVRRELRG